jgi:beta-lactamase regulating signal transducer with metallopeptidase domain/DNA-binding transcriptional regulator GbsR (MarR family)
MSLLYARKAPASVRQNISLIALLSIPVVFAITFFKQHNIYNNIQKISHIEFSFSGTSSFEPSAEMYMLPKQNTELSTFFDANASVIFWLYWSGIAVLSVWFIISYSKSFYIRKKDLSPIPSHWSEIISSTASKVNPAVSYSLFLSPNITVPVVIGFFKPVVLIPVGLATSLTVEEVESILLHEFYHIKCKDHYINALQYIFEILFFYHPFTWWISKTLRAQREEKVDEWVVSQTQNPLHYAQTLLSLEEKRLTDIHGVLAATSNKNSLLLRIKNIMHMKTRKFNSGQKTAALLVISMAIISLAWVNPPAFLAFSPDAEHQVGTTTGNNPVAIAANPDPVQAATLPSDTMPVLPPEPPDQDQNPQRIVMQNGTSISWDELSDEDKEEIRLAITEARIAMRDAMHEIRTELNSDEMKQEMAKVREEIKIAMDEVNRDFQSEEFKAEMREVREEIKQALREVNHELNSEEFKKEMEEAREEIRKALQELNTTMEDEEFQAEMDQISVELQKALDELDSVDWAGLGNDLNFLIQEIGSVVGVALEETFKNLDLNELIEEVESEEQQQEE